MENLTLTYNNLIKQNPRLFANELNKIITLKQLDISRNITVGDDFLVSYFNILYPVINNLHKKNLVKIINKKYG